MRPLRYTDVSSNLPSLPLSAGHGQCDVSLPVSRTWNILPLTRQARLPHDHEHGHGHAHGTGKVPLDLDEAAYGAKMAAKNFGPWVQRAILGAGVWYAFDGSHHAFEELTAWPHNHDAIKQNNKKLSDVVAYNSIAPESQTAAASNLKAMQRISNRQTIDSYAGGVLAAASCIGCAFMGLGLAFDDQMLGYIKPMLVNYTGACMGVAVPMMVIYALGVAATAGRDLYETKNKPAKLLADAAAKTGLSDVEQRAYQVAAASVGARRSLSCMAAVAGVAMGVGIFITCNITLWGLALMMPGALSLPGIMAARHKPGLNGPRSIPQGLNQGDKTAIANELVYLHNQKKAVETHVQSHITSGRQRWGLQDLRFENPTRTVRWFLKERANITAEHLTHVAAAEVDQTTLAENTIRLQRHAALSASADTQQNRFLYKEMVRAIVQDGLFDQFALAIANTPSARDCLTGATAASNQVDVSRDSLHALLETDDAEIHMAHRTQEMAKIYLSIMYDAGHKSLANQQEQALDLWLAHND